MSLAKELIKKINENKVDWSKLDKVPFAKAQEMLNDVEAIRLDDPYEAFEDFDMGSGKFELWYEKHGGKITLSDIKKLDQNDCSSLVFNVFYQRIDLKKALTESVLKAAIIKSLPPDKDMGPMIYDIYGDSDDNLKSYKGKWKKLAKFLYDEEAKVFG